MRLVELLDMASWQEVRDAFRRGYPGMAADLPGIRKAFESLRATTPGKSESVLSFRPVFVSGNSIDVLLVATGGKAADNPVYGLALTPWDEWLAMEVDLVEPHGGLASVIIAECLFEMTLLGFTAEDVAEKIRSMENGKTKKIKAGRKPGLPWAVFKRGNAPGFLERLDELEKGGEDPGDSGSDRE